MATAVLSASEHSADFYHELAALHGRCFATGWNAGAFAGLLESGFTDVLSWRSGGNAALAGFVLMRTVAGEGEILALCVDPAHRRGGAGRDLLNMALTHMLAHGAGEVFLEVAVDNRAALSLYRSAGFRTAGRRHNYYSGADQPKDALVMRLANIVMNKDLKWRTGEP